MGRLFKIGSVKIDVDRDNIQWHFVNLSEPSSVKGLIKYRTTFDLLYQRKSNSVILDSFQDLSELPDEVICLYTWLDECIKNCQLTKRQSEILNEYSDGYTEEEIAENYNVASSTINGILDSCCEKISRYANNQWKNEYVLWSKQKVKTKYKKCTKCKEFLPSTEEYFRKREDSIDGFRHICKKCESSAKKT
jgi:predicted DNA-binding protein YlxM (UPF0122 family)